MSQLRLNTRKVFLNTVDKLTIPTLKQHVKDNEPCEEVWRKGMYARMSLIGVMYECRQNATALVHSFTAFHPDPRHFDEPGDWTRQNCG